PISNSRSAGMGQLLGVRDDHARGGERARVDTGLARAVERFLRLRAELLRQQREAEARAALHVLVRARTRHAADATDEALALGDADRAARIERVERVAALHAELVRGQHEAALEQALALALVVVEVRERDLRLQLLEVVLRVLDFPR